MTRFKSTAALFLLTALAWAAAPGAARAQQEPIIVKQPKPKTVKFKGYVINATRVQITVRSRENERVVRTFQLTPELAEKMQKIIDQGGYQNGDKVEIHYREGSEVAHKIKGKPSKPAY